VPRTKASVTVAIPARNASSTIRLCLESIGRLTVGVERVMVIDDGSTDQTAAIAASLGAEVVAAPTVNNLGAARSLALSLCRTRYLAFLNSDCYVEANWLAALLEAVEAGAAIAGGRQIEERRQSWAERWKSVHLRQDLGLLPLIDPDYLSGGNLLVDVASVARIGFDERYTIAYEDVDFCRRARNAGLRLAYEPRAVVRHDHKETLRSLPIKVWSYGASSHSLGAGLRRRDALAAFLRMHRRPNDQVRMAWRSDLEARRVPFLMIDAYLFAASFLLFLASAIAPDRIPGSPPTFRQRVGRTSHV